MPVVLRRSSVRPHTGVASEPAYVVGTATIGRPLVSATALANPVVDPPPTHSTRSAPTSSASRRASSATSTGTWGRTSRKWPTTGRSAEMERASSDSAAVETSRTRCASSRATSSVRPVRAEPAPKTTRWA